MPETSAGPPTYREQGQTGGAERFVNDRVAFTVGTRAAGSTVKLDVGPDGMKQSLYILHTATGAETMFSAKTCANFRKDNTVYQETRTVLGDGLLTAQDSEWLRQKRFVQPVFTRARVDGYVDMMVEEIADLANAWRTSMTIDTYEAMVHLTLRIVGRVLFGEGLDEHEAALAAEFTRAEKGILKRVMFGGRVPLSAPNEVNDEVNDARSKLYAVVDTIIADRRAADVGAEDLISLLLAARDGGEQLSDAEVRDQVLIFLLAGHETTAAALAFAIHLLGRHPEVLARVRAEVVGTCGAAAPTAEDIHGRLPYTTAVVKETMRMYPSAPFVGRRATEACQIDGYSLPAGADTISSIWSVHHDPDLWPDPDRFDPERFMGEGPANRYAWIPFGAGPRACIGQHFSMLESVAAVAMLAREFDLTAVTESDLLPVSSAITLFPLDPVLVKVRPIVSSAIDA